MQIIVFLSGILNLILGVTILASARSKVQRNFAYLVFLIALWVFVNFAFFWSSRYPVVNFSYFIGALIGAYMFFWVELFTGRRSSSWIRILVMTGLAVNLTISLIPDQFVASKIHETALGVVIAKGPLYVVFSIIETLTLLGALALLIVSFIRSKSIQRIQMKFALFGFAIPIVLIILIDFVLPFFGYLWVINLDSATSFIFASCVAFAITRYRFMDVKLLIRKGLIQFATFSSLFALYAYLVIFLERTVPNLTGRSTQLTLIVAVMFVALTVEPFRRFVYKSVDRLFSRQQKREQEALRRLTLLTHSVSYGEEILEKTEEELSALLPEYSIEVVKKFGSNKQITNQPGLITVTGTSSVYNLFSSNQELAIIDEVPYRIGKYTEAEIRLFKQSQEFFAKNKVKAVMPFGTRDQLVALLFVTSKSKRKVLFSGQIDLLKRIHNTSNEALIQAEMYQRALERAVNQSALQ